jgi:GTPase SAR1 family protein
LLSLTLCGCIFHKTDLGVPVPKVSPKSLQKDLSKEIKSIQKESAIIYENTAESKHSAKGISTISVLRPDTTQERINEILKEIDDYAENIDKKQRDIIKSTTKLDEATRGLSRVDIELMGVNQYLKDVAKNNGDLHDQNAKLQKQHTKGQEELREYEEGVAAQNNKIWMGIVSGCALFAALGVAIAIWVNPKIGIGITSACLIMSSIAYFMAKFAWIVAIVGGVLFLGGVVWALWFFVIHKKALVESTISMETLKHKDWDEAKDTIANVQSTSTASLIRDLKYKNKIGK